MAGDLEVVKIQLLWEPVNLEILKIQPFLYSSWIWKNWRTLHSDIIHESGNIEGPTKVAAGVRLGKNSFWEAVPGKMDMHILEKEHFCLYVDTFSKMAPQAKPLCPYDAYRNSVQNRGINAPSCLIWVQIHKDKLQI